MYVMGYDRYGQMGLGFPIDSAYSPIALNKALFNHEDAVSVVAGAYHTFVLTSNTF
jgi:hypothetical protein